MPLVLKILNNTSIMDMGSLVSRSRALKEDMIMMPIAALFIQCHWPALYILLLVHTVILQGNLISTLCMKQFRFRSLSCVTKQRFT